MNLLVSKYCSLSFEVVIFEWTKYLSPYAVTFKNVKIEKNLQFKFQF